MRVGEIVGSECLGQWTMGDCADERRPAATGAPIKLRVTAKVIVVLGWLVGRLAGPHREPRWRERTVHESVRLLIRSDGGCKGTR
jgi:hypothetical protein